MGARRTWTCWLMLPFVGSSGTRPIVGFADCTGDAVGDSAVTRAWRRAMLDGAHPDKGGDSEAAVAATELRAQLRDPLRMQIARVMHGHLAVQPFGEAYREASPVRAVSARIKRVERWPYLFLEAAFAFPKELGHGAGWDLAFGAKGLSSIHYHGDERAGGYDVCCDFVQNSSCVRAPARRACNTDPDGVEVCTGSADALQLGGNASQYSVHDCPLSREFTAAVRKPLHRDEVGQWGAALQLRDGDGNELACVAIALEVLHDASAAYARDSDAPRPDAGFETRRPSPESAQSPDPSPSQPPPASFRLLLQGKSCGDGGDIMEGRVDDYSPGAGSGFYGGRCRDRCRKRKRCQYYTAFSSGWCQLSTRCADVQPAGDPLAVTFEKVG
mmetsp:Transcript_57767/g.161137  ORF Transcript_57767/g.161137 Transcript_57767/m.161137 type:complete len:386 (-) Transcript_57767:71-1228(-)